MDQDTSEIRDEVEEARENLGETVEALAYKANAPKRLKDRATATAHAAKDTATTKLADVKQQASRRPKLATDRIDPGSDAQNAESHLETPQEGIAHAGNGHQARPAAGNPSQPLQPAVNLVKRHPSATAAAAIGLTVGIALGRITNRK
jgi:hypothetical protein